LAFISGRTNQRISKKSPADYLPKVIAERGVEALEKQCIPLDPNLHQLSSYREFLAARRAALAAAINEFTGRVKPGGLA